MPDEVIVILSEEQKR